MDLRVRRWIKCIEVVKSGPDTDKAINVSFAVNPALRCGALGYKGSPQPLAVPVTSP